MFAIDQSTTANMVPAFVVSSTVPKNCSIAGRLVVVDATSRPEKAESSKKDLGIEPETAMVDVSHIEHEALIPRESLPSLYLCPTSDAGPHFVTAHLLG